MTADGTKHVGQPLSRVDGPLKVTGRARYVAEFAIPDLAHAVLVQSPVGRGKVRSIETDAAERAPGVLAVLTRRNAPPLKRLLDDITGPGKHGEWRAPLEDDVIHYAGQHLGIVVAGTLEQARHATGKRIRDLPITPEKLL